MRHGISPPKISPRLLLLLPLRLLLPMSCTSALDMLRYMQRLLVPILIPLVIQLLIRRLAEGIVQRMTLSAVV
jgi:predicted Na+-dependent transporter